MTNIVTFPALGLQFTVNRVCFSIAGVNIYWYGVLIALGLMLALVFAFRHCAEFGLDGDGMIDVILIGTVAAIVCGRAYYVATAPFAYQSVWDMLNIRQGGIAIYGGIIGAFVFGALAAWWRKVPVPAMADLAGMGFLIGQCIGRWGNFVNQEAFGCNTTLPWGMYSAATEAYLRSSMVTAPQGAAIDPTQPVHPTFLYESLWCLAGFVLLRLWVKRRHFAGEIALFYVMWYGAGRFWIEALRTDSLMLAPAIGLRISQVVAAASALCAAAVWLWQLRRHRGRQLAVPLALDSQNRAKLAGRPPEGLHLGPEVKTTLPASASRAQFIAATAAFNQAVAQALAGGQNP